MKEFQAVVMAAGRGTRMAELTAGKPKCLLPIGNKPMIWYPLHLLQRTGIRDAIVVVIEQARSEVQAALERTGLKIQLEFVGIPGSEDWGTADTLRHIGDRIKTDALVLSSDLVTDIKLFKFLDVHRKHSNGIVGLFFHPPQQDDTAPRIAVPGPKSKQKPEQDLVGLDAQTSRLAFLASVSDFDDTVPLSRKLLKKHHHLEMYSQLTDAHLYVIKHWVIQFLLHDKSFSTLKGELIPYIVKKQASKLNKPRSETENNVIEDVKKDIFHFAQEDALTLRIRKMSFYNDHTGDMAPVYHGDTVRCYGYLAPTENFGIRANTVAAYCDINRKIKALYSAVTHGNELAAIHASSTINSTQMDDSCLVGEQTNIAEKTSIKSSNIGAHCQIETKVRLTNCIVMNGVKIREGCVISNCVLCDDVEVGTNAKLTDCLVGSRHTVQPEAVHANEVLTDVDRLMEI